MIPTIKLTSSLNDPFIEIPRAKLYPLLALILDSKDLLTDECYSTLFHFLYLDSLRGEHRNRDFFTALRNICENVSTGELISINIDRVSAYDIAGDVLYYIPDGVVTENVKQAAARYLSWADEHKAEYPILE